MILVVDHDQEVLNQAATILNRTRQVFLASSGKRALELIEELKDFSVVLVDLDLPDAYALIEKLHDGHPDLLIIATHGAMKSSIRNATEMPGVIAMLQKPITPDWKPVVERVRAIRSRRSS